MIGGRCNPRSPLLPQDEYVQVVFRGTLQSRIDLTSSRIAGFRMTAPPGATQLGASLAAPGDVNGDGLADVLVGAPADVDQPGAAYLIYGKRSSGPVDVTHLGENGFAINGATGMQIYQAAMVVSAAGDVNEARRRQRKRRLGINSPGAHGDGPR